MSCPWIDYSLRWFLAVVFTGWQHILSFVCINHQNQDVFWKAIISAAKQLSPQSFSFKTTLVAVSSLRKFLLSFRQTRQLKHHRCWKNGNTKIWMNVWRHWAQTELSRKMMVRWTNSYYFVKYTFLLFVKVVL